MNCLRLGTGAPVPDRVSPGLVYKRQPPKTETVDMRNGMIKTLKHRKIPCRLKKRKEMVSKAKKRLYAQMAPILKFSASNNIL